MSHVIFQRTSETAYNVKLEDNWKRTNEQERCSRGNDSRLHNCHYLIWFRLLFRDDGKMKFQPTIDVWSLNQEQRKALQPGQWVYAGDPKDKGVWCGQRSSGADVVAWYGNAKNRKSYNEYVKALMGYAKG